MSAIDAIPVPTKKSPSILLFLPEDEFHELGLLMSKYLLKKKRINSYYLGCNTPIASVESTVDAVHPEVVMTFLITKKPMEQIHEYLESLKTKFQNQELWVAAHKSVLALLDDQLGMTKLDSIASFVNLLDEHQTFVSR